VIASCTFVSKANLFVPFLLFQTHDSCKGTSVDCRRGVEECPTESVAAYRECVRALSWRRMTPHDNMLGLLVFIVLLSCSRFSAKQMALTMMPLGNQSISQGPRQVKNSITLPAVGMA